MLGTVERKAMAQQCGALLDITTPQLMHSGIFRAFNIGGNVRRKVTCKGLKARIVIQIEQRLGQLAQDFGRPVLRV